MSNLSLKKFFIKDQLKKKLIYLMKLGIQAHFSGLLLNSGIKDMETSFPTHERFSSR